MVNHLGGMSGGHYTAFIKCATVDPTSLGSGAHNINNLLKSAVNAEGNTVFLDSTNFYKNPLEANRYHQYARCADANTGGAWFLFDDDLVLPVPEIEIETHVVSGMYYYCNMLSCSLLHYIITCINNIYRIRLHVILSEATVISEHPHQSGALSQCYQKNDQYKEKS